MLDIKKIPYFSAFQWYPGLYDHVNDHCFIGTRAFCIAAKWGFGFPHNWESCRNHVASYTRCQELTPNKIHWPTPIKIHWPTLSHNIAGNNFMTDYVALFWCRSRAARWFYVVLVLSGHDQKTQKQPSTSVGHISSIKLTNEYSEAVAL